MVQDRGRVLIAVALALVAFRAHPSAAEPARPAVRAGHPRLLLDDAARARLKQAAARGTPAWRATQARCQQTADGKADGGYWAFDWGHAMADLALCWYATGDARYAGSALQYFRQILDDEKEAGDHKGGAKVVTNDSGYPMRTYPVYTALGYDWLHDAPGMTPALRAKAADRLRGWIDWYERSGYHRDEPGGNYFMGYYTAVALAGLALDGESPEAPRWRRLAEDQLGARLLRPFLRDKMQGGDYAEGWQYGELYTAELSIIAEATRTATGVSLAAQIPWLAEVVKHHLYALQPGGATVYDAGDWSDRPARPSRLALAGLALALDGVNPQAAAQARFQLTHLPPDVEETGWITMLAERPGAPQSDPKIGAPLGYHAGGTGLTLWRSGFGPGDLFVGFVAGPHLVEDHQHYDQGHFELWRGPDALLIDGADYATYASINHNTLLIDDGGRVLDYSPNQGDFGDAKTVRLGDDGVLAVAVGDLTGAFFPACAPHSGCTDRVVKSVVRTMAYLRPATLFVSDRIELVNPKDGVTFLLHTTVAPSVRDGRLTAIVGGSRLDAVAIEPARASVRVAKQPTRPDTGHGVQDNPWGPIWRAEIDSPRGLAQRRFIEVLAASAAGAPAAEVLPVAGDGLRGAAVGDATHRQAVLFPEGLAGGRATLPAGTGRVFVVGLDPAAGYRVQAQGCAVSVAAGGSERPGSGGSVARDLVGCAR